MYYYDSFYKEVENGDKIVTSHNILKGERIVLFATDYVKLENGKHWFLWDNFFEVNHPIKIIKQ